MRTRIKEFRKKNGKVSFYVVQELGNDGMFRTIDGGMCDSREEAEKVRARYKRVAKDVAAFNKRFQCNTITLPVDFQRCDYQKNKSHEEGRD